MEDIIEVLNDPEVEKRIRGIYKVVSTHLRDEFKCIDEDTMISYAKAYLIREYNSIENKYDKKHFIVEIKKAIIYPVLGNFIRSLNGTLAKPGELVNKYIVSEIRELKDSKDTEVYRILSQNNKYIAKEIARYHGFHTIEYFKRKAKENENVQSYLEHIIPEEELKIIEATKNYPIPNQIAHTLYDVRNNIYYYCDHTINSEDEILKNLLVSTKQHNPRFEIVFKDGTIVEYNNGDIRIKPYTFKQLVEYTKLYFAKEFNGLLSTYDSCNQPTTLGQPVSNEKKGKDMLLDSYTVVRNMFIEYEEIYTQKMIEDSKKELALLKETSKKYHL